MSKSNKKERSRAYPVMALEEALNRISSVNVNLGLKGQFNRESIAVGMGYSSLNGASARAVAALVHYGLLERERDQYSLSSMARKYLLPVNDGDQERAIRDAALSPSLFKEIYDSFKGQVIPRQFANRLVQEFGIQQKAAPDVERIFRNTMATAGVLKNNGVLDASLNTEDTGNDVQTTPETISALDAPKPTEPEAPVQPKSGFLSVELPSGLVVSYSQELASAFAFGLFGQKLKDLDDAVNDHIESLSKQADDHKEKGDNM